MSDENSISVVYDESNNEYRLILYWWVTYSVVLRLHQLKALHKVVGDAIAKADS